MFWRFFNGRRKGGDIGITDGESRDRESNSVVVDTRGNNSHEAGGTRLAVLKLNLDHDWPCTRRGLSHRSAFGKLARCRIFETLGPKGFARCLPSSRFTVISFSPLSSKGSPIHDREHACSMFVTFDYVIDR